MEMAKQLFVEEFSRKSQLINEGKNKIKDKIAETGNCGFLVCGGSRVII
jgi:hypothetical protein